MVHYTGAITLSGPSEQEAGTTFNVLVMQMWTKGGERSSQNSGLFLFQGCGPCGASPNVRTWTLPPLTKQSKFSGPVWILKVANSSLGCGQPIYQVTQKPAGFE